MIRNGAARLPVHWDLAVPKSAPHRNIESTSFRGAVGALSTGPIHCCTARALVYESLCFRSDSTSIPHVYRHSAPDESSFYENVPTAALQKKTETTPLAQGLLLTPCVDTFNATCGPRPTRFHGSSCFFFFHSFHILRQRDSPAPCASFGYHNTMFDRFSMIYATTP
jgi:hypothetical protein